MRRLLIVVCITLPYSALRFSWSKILSSTPPYSNLPYPPANTLLYAQLVLSHATIFQPAQRDPNLFLVHATQRHMLYSTRTTLALLFPTLFCSTLLYSTSLYSILLYTTLLYSNILYSALLYSFLLHSTLLVSTPLSLRNPTPR